MKMNTSEAVHINIEETLPYPPSFIDRFIHFIQRLPIPYWLTYLLLFILESVTNHVLAWIDGWLPTFTFNGIIILFPLWQWGTLAIITYLNKTSEAALSSFRPLLDGDDDALNKLKYEFTNLPSRDVIISGITWILVYLLLTYLAYGTFYVGYGLGSLFSVIIFLEGLVSFSTGSALYYHAIRQLWLVYRTVKTVKQFNLFHLQPVYAFSRLTSRTGISWMFLLGLTMMMFPLMFVTGLTLAIIVLQLVLAVAAFVLPLQFVNQNLVSEKRRLLAENDRRVELALMRLHQNFDENELSEIAQFNQAIAGLDAERNILSKISTWPWRTETLTGFLSAIVLPIIFVIIQIFIRKWLGG